jgi:hypothetical protein
MVLLYKAGNEAFEILVEGLFALIKEKKGLGEVVHAE